MKKNNHRWSLLMLGLPLALLLGCAALSVHSEDEEESATAPPANGAAQEPADEEVTVDVDEEVATTLVDLLDEQKLRRSTEELVRDYQETILSDIIKFTTPAGYRLKIRYRELGIPVVQALSYTKIRQLQNRLLEAARWVGSPYVRSEALLGLAAQHDVNHFKFFREALLDMSTSIQFAAVEALQIWNHPEANALLWEAANKSWSPILRVYAAQALWRMGDLRGRERLMASLKEQNWVVRAMATRYLGDLGGGEDADFVLSRIGPEQGNRFVLAETCIAALKLTAKKLPEPPPPPPPKAKRRGPVSVTKRNDIFELEPLVVTAPRQRLPPQPVDVRIDNDLVALLEKLANEPPPDEIVVDPALSELLAVVTPTGFNLRIRYTDITFLIIEGLAGTRDFGLVRRVESIAKENASASVRAAALVTLSFEKGRDDIYIFMQALRDTNVAVRFGALEALNEMDTPQAQNLLADASSNDASKALRLFASQALARSGDDYGRRNLLSFLNDPDWVARAMAVRFLGEVGSMDDYYRVSGRLAREDNNFVMAEACLAMLRLAKEEQK